MSSFFITHIAEDIILPAVVTSIKTSYTAPVRAPTAHLPVLDLDSLPSSTFWTVLGRALTLRRDHLSKTEAWFVGWLANRLPVYMIDEAGNLYVDMRTDPTHRTMFTAHTDSVHSGGGINTVHVDGNIWRAGDGAALGADDGAGIAIMCHMIEAGVPGLYVFFRGEERGGIGSSWAAEHMPELFIELDRAIAFDRADYYDIITHQSGGRCCSDVFAQALANTLSTAENWYMPCSTGVYTDTAEFTRLIPECTNISVGYRNQHGDREQQDVDFLWWLAQQCVTVSWDNLPTKRDPNERESRYADIDPDWYLGYRAARGGSAPASTKPSLEVYADDEEDDDGDMILEQALWDAMDGALYSASYGALIDLIANEAYPEEPALARRRILVSALDQETLDIAMEMLDTGWPAHQVLIELWDLTSIP